MYLKLGEVLNKFLKKGRIILIVLTLINIFIIFCINIYQGNLKSAFNFPEARYQLLEQEAKKIILNQNFNTDYYFIINHYDSESGSLHMTIYDNEISLIVEVENYQENNSEINFQRNITKQMKIAKYFCSIILIGAVFSIIEWIAISIILVLVIWITFIVSKSSIK